MIEDTDTSPVEPAVDEFSGMLFAPEPMPEPAPPATALEEPQAGGRYLRDPVTGALSVNPD
jgi:hypothetical protein